MEMVREEKSTGENDVAEWELSCAAGKIVAALTIGLFENLDIMMNKCSSILRGPTGMMIDSIQRIISPRDSLLVPDYITNSLILEATQFKNSFTRKIYGLLISVTLSWIEMSCEGVYTNALKTRCQIAHRINSWLFAPVSFIDSGAWSLGAEIDVFTIGCVKFKSSQLKGNWWGRWGSHY